MSTVSSGGPSDVRAATAAALNSFLFASGKKVSSGRASDKTSSLVFVSSVNNYKLLMLYEGIVDIQSASIKVMKRLASFLRLIGMTGTSSRMMV